MNKSKSSIIEVYEHNFKKEIKILSSLLDEYSYVAMDTEFPGIVFQLDSYSKDFYYKSLKLNVDNLKLIQVGITLCDENGNHPPYCSTWQFNLKFNLQNEKFSYESIALLNNSGINFEILAEKGIPYEFFAEYFISSGLFLNEDITWISFHGAYDFAYLLKIISGKQMPEFEYLFFENLDIYFQNYFDIRHLIRGGENFKGGLSRVAQELEVVRIGTTHQAGSDSIVTAEVFFRLIKKSYLTNDMLIECRNILFGLGDGADNKETISYAQFQNINPAFQNGVYSQIYPTNKKENSSAPQNANQINVLYSYINKNNVQMPIYNYNVPQMQQIINMNVNLNTYNNSMNNNKKPLNVNLNNSNGSQISINSMNTFNGSNSFNNKQKKKNFGSSILEAYSN